MTTPEKKLILYGAGYIGKDFVFYSIGEGVQIECFCDSDPQKCEKDLFGYPVKSIDEIKRCYPKGSYHILFTMLEKTAKNLKESLIEKNIFSISDFYDEEIDSLGVKEFFAPWNRSFTIPQELEQNFRYLNEKDESELKKGLLFHYFGVSSYDDLLSDCARKDFSEHLYSRLEDDRKKVIPWLDSIYKLKGASILEIGCGTGTSTVALCEQEAKVTAIDVSKNAIEAAKVRLKSYGLTADFRLVNAENILEELSGKSFDYVIFFASLEHMTFQERIQSLKAAFQMLNSNGYVVLVEIPNRLWYIDGHTSFEPFYNWLPDTLAMEYAKFTQRERFNKGFDSTSEDDTLKFARWGRGVSYHELEIALGERSRIQVISSLNLFLNGLNGPYTLLKKILKMVGPEDIHEGFYEPLLNIILKKVSVSGSYNVVK